MNRSPHGNKKAREQRRRGEREKEGKRGRVTKKWIGGRLTNRGKKNVVGIKREKKEKKTLKMEKEEEKEKEKPSEEGEEKKITRNLE